MKEEWKPEEMRATSEEIRGAVMPKSITPEMVGGTLLGVVNALGEVVEVLGEIPREHVRVKVRGYDSTGEVSGAGATVWLDIFNTQGYPAVSIPRRELICNEEGVVEFDVPHGFKFAIFSQIDGLGASFQMVYSSSSAERDITLWNPPIGIYLNWCAYFHDENDDDYYPSFPAVSLNADISQDQSSLISLNREGSIPDDCHCYGILVSTADTSFIISINNSRHDGQLIWCGSRNRRGVIPTLPEVKGADGGDFAEWQNLARVDMDGNMNTAKITGFYKDAPAADWAESGGDWEEQRWLPSCGQMYLMWSNRAAINTLMQLINDAWGEEMPLFPYQNSEGRWQYPFGFEYWWTSTVFDDSCSWVVDYGGNIINYDRYDTYDVRAVSAFHFEY